MNFLSTLWSRLGDLLSSIHVLTELFVENMKLFSAEGVRYLEIQRRLNSYKDEQGEIIQLNSLMHIGNGG